MAAPIPTTRRAGSRPTYRNVQITDLMRYRLPLPGIVSILHRISGALLFVFLWLILWLLQASVTDSSRFTAIYASPVVKLIVFALLWSAPTSRGCRPRRPPASPRGSPPTSA